MQDKKKLLTFVAIVFVIVFASCKNMEEINNILKLDMSDFIEQEKQ